MSMFGLQSGKKKKPEEFFFDLEKELRDRVRARELHEMIMSRLQKINGILREGSSEEEMKFLYNLLQGYTALLKVVGRIIART